ncbi:hypothetical protein BJV78DRAFT_268868 [Lactifluus subvellereus]|nr:hypothetical protein BJV78DRAFT_268868 [Lactifluus subvellereus]
MSGDCIALLQLKLSIVSAVTGPYTTYGLWSVHIVHEVLPFRETLCWMSYEEWQSHCQISYRHQRIDTIYGVRSTVQTTMIMMHDGSFE